MKNECSLRMRFVQATAALVVVASTMIGCSSRDWSGAIGSNVVHWMPPRTIAGYDDNIDARKRSKRFVVNIPVFSRSNSLGHGGGGGRKPDESKRVPAGFDEDEEDLIGNVNGRNKQPQRQQSKNRRRRSRTKAQKLALL